jgi:ketosteroid isomerase-like protein
MELSTMRVLFTATFALSLGAASAALASAPTPQQRAELVAVAAAGDAAYNAGEAAALAALYTEDGTARLGYEMKPIAGRAALQGFLKQAIAPNARHVTALDHIEMVSDNVALADARVTIELGKPNGEWQLVRVFRNNTVLRRDEGQWKIHSIRAHPQPLPQ